ncbi:MAG: CDP-glycerol glycerophosphotransferase family protein [bacterium]|nr:CDP-glycerol glycerophosphotransferase family protein [bacterium]
MQPIIKRIFWKRTYLFIEYESTKDINLCLNLFNKDKKGKIKLLENKILLETKKLDKNYYRSKINITIAEGREILKSGGYMISSDEKLCISNEILLNIEDLSRVFRYGGWLESYIVTFHITEEEPHQLYLYTSYMIDNKHPEKKHLFSSIRLATGFSHKLKTLIAILGKRCLNIYYQILTHIIPKNGKRILFLSQNMDHIRDNMTAVYDRIYERNLDKKYKIRKNFVNIFDGKIRVFYWIKLLTQISYQDYIFVDDYVPVFSFINLNKKTTLTQLWHAGFGFKLVGYGRFGIAGSPRPYESCHRQYTYGIIGNDHLKEIYSEVWGIEKEALLATGMPRLEHFLDKEYIKKVTKSFYDEYPQFKNKKIITFAPTYRGNSQKEAYYDYSKIDFDALYNFCKKNDYIVAFGKHHFILQDIPIKKEHSDLIYDMSKYKLNDLLYITDILITDYSSCFYDYLLLERPVLFYAYDKDIYSATRGVHRPIDKVAPGKVCTTFDQIMEALENKDYGEKEKFDFLVDKCLTNKKIASDQIIDYIILNQRD